MKQMATVKKTKNNEFNINSLLSELNRIKIVNLSTNNDIHELKKEVYTLSRALGALIDLISDTTSIPNGLIAERFMFYNQERHVVGLDGKVKGEAVISYYNFDEEGY